MKIRPWRAGLSVPSGDLVGVAFASQPPPNGLCVHMGHARPWASFPVPASNGTLSGVFWSDGSSIKFAAVGAPLTLGAMGSFAGIGTNKSAVVHASTFYVAWEDTSNSDTETIFIGKMGADGKPGTRVPVPSDTTSGADWPSLTSAGDLLAVAYYQFRDGPPSIFLARFNSDLTRVGTDDLMLSVATETDRFPSVAWTGTEFGVAYAETDGKVKLALARCH